MALIFRMWISLKFGEFGAVREIILMNFLRLYPPVSVITKPHI